MKRFESLAWTIPAIGSALTGLAIWAALIAVSKIPNNAWHDHLLTCVGCPEPPCPNPFDPDCDC